MPHSIPRLFVLRRDRDITGVSGAGDVADGVQWADGTVVLRWRERPSTAVWDSLELMLSVHGHDGATRVVWADDSRAQSAADRAYKLAERWQAAHGAAMFLVRTAGAELRDVLEEDQADGRGLAAVECSAQYNGGFEFGVRQCIRAAQHCGDHIDENGFHWSDTVAVYPVDDSQAPPNQGPLSGIEVRHPCPYCEGCPLVPRHLMDDHVREQHPEVRVGGPGIPVPPTDSEGAGLTPRQRAYKAVSEHMLTLGYASLATRSHIWRAVNRALDAAGHPADPAAQC
ncbi:hypothetical protein [Streptomyces sp. NPDC002520]